MLRNDFLKLKKYWFWLENFADKYKLAIIFCLGVELGVFSSNACEASKKQQEVQKERVVVQEQPQPNLEDIVKKEDSLAISYVTLDNQGWSIPILSSNYFKYKTQNHRINNTADYLKFVTYKDSNIIDIAKKITEKCKTQEEKATILLDLVHQYVYDKRSEGENTDYVRFPLETIVEGNGDCEDLSILAAALMKSVGIDVVLLHFPNPEKGKPGHIALGVVGDFKGVYYESDDKKYFYTETTGTDSKNKPSTWKIGEVPKNYKDRKTFVYVVK